MNILQIILIGISLSLDAFSLIIAISINYKVSLKKYPITVGIYHFIMPILGYFIKNIFNKVISIPSDIIFILIIIYLIINMLQSLKKETEIKYINHIVFGFIVSLDALSVGLILDKSNMLLASFIFMFISSIFTFIGIKIGNLNKDVDKNITTCISICILLVILVYKLFF